MNNTQVKFEYQVLEDNGQGMAVIVVAAGSSTRMQGQNKQFSEINGIPVIAKTLLTFEKCPEIKNIILVVRAEDIFSLQMLAEKYSISKLSDIVCGGATRQESVLKGFSRLDESDTAVLIHDGARPLITQEIISSVVKALDNYTAVTCAVKVKDTVKQIDESGKVIKTLNRDTLVAVQTPQGVRVKEYLDAVEKIGDVSSFTDDTSIMETAGYEVYAVEGSYKNIKITTPEDINIACAYEGEEL